MQLSGDEGAGAGVDTGAVRESFVMECELRRSYSVNMG